jgi:hypothetical protein
LVLGLAQLYSNGPSPGLELARGPLTQRASLARQRPSLLSPPTSSAHSLAAPTVHAATAMCAARLILSMLRPISFFHPRCASLFHSHHVALSLLCSSSRTEHRHRRERHRRASSARAVTLMRRLKHGHCTGEHPQRSTRRCCRRGAPPRGLAPPATKPPHRPFHEHHADEDLLHEPLASSHNPQSGPSPVRPSAPTVLT